MKKLLSSIAIVSLVACATASRHPERMPSSESLSQTLATLFSVDGWDLMGNKRSDCGLEISKNSDVYDITYKDRYQNTSEIQMMIPKQLRDVSISMKGLGVVAIRMLEAKQDAPDSLAVRVSMGFASHQLPSEGYLELEGIDLQRRSVRRMRMQVTIDGRMVKKSCTNISR